MSIQTSDAKALINELASLLLAGESVAVSFAIQLGRAYEETKTWPALWVGQVVRRGVAAEASLDLVRWLILKDFNAREVPHDATEVVAFIDGLYAEPKGIFDRNPSLYKMRHKEVS